MVRFCRLRAAVAWVLLAVVVSSASAHDLWLVPEERPVENQPVRVHANSGMDFPISVSPADPANFEKRIVINPEGERAEMEAVGKDGNSGVLRFTPKVAGTYIVAVETKPKVITLEADEFNEYLVADGLPHIYRLRAKEKTLDQPARERYSKFPKAIVQVGKGVGDVTRVVGMKLEIVPLKDPPTLHLGGTLRVRVLFEGKPLADANLGWDVPGDGEAPSGTVRTNDRGEALVPLPEPGLMTIRLTHMTRPKHDDYEWESFWATLTFQAPRVASSRSSR